MLTVSDLHDILERERPPVVRGAPKRMIIISPERSLLAPTNNYDEVVPGIYLGDQVFAKDRRELSAVGITHILNAAYGHRFHQVNTGPDFYAEDGITFLGIRAMDTAGFKMDDHFKAATQYISQALENNGRVAVHCVQGISRSAALVVAFLMLERRLPLVDALVTIRRKRAIYPNNGFLKQLLCLNKELFGAGATETDTHTAEGAEMLTKVLV